MSNNLLYLVILAIAFQFSKCQTENNEIYTIQSAQQCFTEKSLPECHQSIQQCLRNQDCKNELMFYQDCSFEKQSIDQIFNGNCFRTWKNTAHQTKDIIDCIDASCNYTSYNSEISLEVLYSCSKQALVQNPVDCNDDCQSILKEYISSKITNMPISQVYELARTNNKINDESVLKIIQIIQQQCIQNNGTIRIRHEQDRLSKKRDKFRLYQQINKKRDQMNQEALNQKTFSQTTSPQTKEL